MSLTYRKPGAKEGRPQTETQRIAAKENFAIFTIKGMKGQLKHILDVPEVAQRAHHLGIILDQMETNIKSVQELRKLKRKEKNHG